MKSYKVEFSEVQKFVFDVQAENEEQAKELAQKEWDDSVHLGITHHHEYGDREVEISFVYDVTGTDDDAFLTNN